MRAIPKNFNTNETISFCLSRFLLPRVEFFFKLPWNAWTVYRKQFPLRLAYANTYNSAIGLTLNKVVLDLRSEVFSHGQLYTGMTRIRGREHGMVLANETGASIFHTVNVAYQELLL